MIERVVINVQQAPSAAPHVQELSRVSAPHKLSRRVILSSIGSLVVTALPTCVVGAPSAQDIIVVDGWILLNTDLR